ncbi:UNC-like C-terminal-domain-containing protein [Trametes punicea]|nr:UNC-like C-terminal-domain-containing protein [Trametes punicea]
MFLSLPTSLLALLFASPLLAAPTTPNDPFHALALYAPKPPEEPVCCLRPLPPLEPQAEDDLLLSFEEWKAKRFSEAAEREPAHPTAHRPPENASQAPIPDTSPQSSDVQGALVSEMQENGATQERMAPHFRIPIHDRFNYASLDCSARVHAAHKSAKYPSAILSSKKDRYMLSPCEEKNQYVIVELCEDIRIDTVQLANYEFFSGVFKDFTVSVSKTFYPNDPDSWTFAGTYRAKNVRGVQSFHTPPTLRDFYRYIRIDFHSHYGNEYYCPLSLLRVYGLTHLEEWQWETWEAESRAKRIVEEASPLVEAVAEPPKPVHVPVLEVGNEAFSVVSGDASPSAGSPSAHVDAVTLDTLRNTHQDSPPSSILESIPKTTDTPRSTTQHSHTETHRVTSRSNTPSMPPDHTQSPAGSLDNSNIPTAISSSVHVSSSSSTTTSSSSSSHPRIVSTDSHSSVVVHNHADSGSHTASPHSSSAASPNVSSLSVLSPSYSHSAPPAPPASTGGESIYRLIMNRLNALEANTTLYARYVEEQTAGMREVLRRLTEDIGRLESIGKAQAQLFHRSVVELEKHTRRLESEHQHLVSRVNHLTDEVVLEKRLGIAQLCLLLTVLVFMALTRGSRGEVVHPARGSMREWGRRTLSFSGDWVNRLRTRSSTPPRPANQKPGENEVAFPKLDAKVAEQLSHSTRRGPSTSSSNRRQATRPHTPTSLRTPSSRHFAHHRAVPLSPSFHLPRPGIQRSSSGSIALGFGGVGPVPKSAKRWARSAHLHEVKGATASSSNLQGSRQEMQAKNIDQTRQAPSSDKKGADAQDVFWSSIQRPASLGASFEGTSTLSKGKARASGFPARQPSPLRPSVVDLSPPRPPSRGRAVRRTSGQTQPDANFSEGDAWVDTDVDGSECDMVVDATALGGGAADSQVARERTYVSGAAAHNSL